MSPKWIEKKYIKKHKFKKGENKNFKNIFLIKFDFSKF